MSHNRHDADGGGGQVRLQDRVRRLVCSRRGFCARGRENHRHAYHWGGGQLNIQTVRRVIIFQVTSVVELGEDGSMISTTKKVKGDIVVPVGIIL